MLFAEGEMERTRCKIVGMKGTRYKLWWSGKGDRVCGEGVMVKEELCDKVLEVRRVSDRVTTVVVEKVVLILICGYTLQSGGSLQENRSFYDKLKCEWIFILQVI